jgi:hypothetical protein
MIELKEGDLVFNARGMPVGVVSEINDDQFIIDRRGILSVPAGEAISGSGTGVVTGSIGPIVRVRFGK